MNSLKDSTKLFVNRFSGLRKVLFWLIGVVAAFVIGKILEQTLPSVWNVFTTMLNSPTPIWLLLILLLAFVAWILYSPKKVDQAPKIQSAPVRYFAFDVLWETNPPNFASLRGPFCPECERSLSWKGKNWQCIDCKKIFVHIPAYDDVTGLGDLKFYPQISDELSALFRTGKLAPKLPGKNVKVNRLS